LDGSGWRTHLAKHGGQRPWLRAAGGQQPKRLRRVSGQCSGANRTGHLDNALAMAAGGAPAGRLARRQQDPRGDVTTLHGDGGAGKTDIALRLAANVAR
jgi:hypothetical protein